MNDRFVERRRHLRRGDIVRAGMHGDGVVYSWDEKTEKWVVAFAGKPSVRLITRLGLILIERDGEPLSDTVVTMRRSR